MVLACHEWQGRGFCFWLVLIFYKVAPKVFPKIPLINNDEFGHYGCFDFRDEWVYKYIDVFKQFDDLDIPRTPKCPKSLIR